MFVPMQMDDAIPSTTTGAGADAGRMSSSEAAAVHLPTGLQYAMPDRGGVSSETLQAEGIGEVDTGIDDLMSQLNALNSNTKAR